MESIQTQLSHIRFRSHPRPLSPNSELLPCESFVVPNKFMRRIWIKQGILEIIGIPVFRLKCIFLVNWSLAAVFTFHCQILYFLLILLTVGSVHCENIFEIGIILSKSNRIKLNTNLLCIKGDNN